MASELHPMDRPWDVQNAELRAVFNAALTGIIANPNFFSVLFQQNPRAAVEFADSVVLAALTPPPSPDLQGRE